MLNFSFGGYLIVTLNQLLMFLVAGVSFGIGGGRRLVGWVGSFGRFVVGAACTVDDY